ncbi:MAG: matrixin family metalloprotease [Deltaproteobacteria bacterium]|nr:matrixin family metalloprotease [Deltaproteobacteria bacterium]
MSASQRRSLGRAALAATVLAIASLAAAPVHAFCRSTTCVGECGRNADGCKTQGHPLYWPTMCVGFSLQQNGSVNIDMPIVRGVVQDSFVAWSDRECPEGGLATMAFTELKDVACHEIEYNPDGANANAVMFEDYKWTYSDSCNTLAKTTVTYDSETGEIFDADMQMNHAYNELTWTDDYVVFDMQSIFTHEVGHFIGLDHTLDYDATMNATYEEGTVFRRTVEADDVGALCAAYPPERQAACSPTPRGGWISDCGGGVAAADAGGCNCAGAGAAAGGHGEPRGAWAAGAAVLGLWLASRRRRDKLL